MKNDIFYYAVSELLLSIFLGVSLLYFTYRLIERGIKKKYNIGDNNLSYSIFMSSILFSVAYLIKDIKTPILNSIRILQESTDDGSVLFFDVTKYTLLFLVVVILSIFIINLISLSLFTFMTKNIEEFQEIQKNNIAVAIFTGVIVISISIMLKDSLYFLLDTFVPYPDVPKFE